MTMIFSIHYFLWYGALTSIFGYESVYARYYTNASPMQYGYLNMVLPFMTVLVTPMICSLADRQRSHRSHFTLSLVITTVAMCFFALMPLLSTDNKGGGSSINSGNQTIGQEGNKQTDGVKGGSNVVGHLLLGPWVYYCLNSLVCDLAIGINTCLSDSFAVLQAEERGTSFGRVIVWGTFGWASTALILSLINQWSGLPRLIPGLIFGSLLLATDVILVSLWPQESDFRLDIIPIDAAQTLTGSASRAHKDPSDYQPMNESALINLGAEIDEQSRTVSRKTVSPVKIFAEKNKNISQSSALISGRLTGKAAKNKRKVKGLDGKSVNSVKTIDSDILDPPPAMRFVSDKEVVNSDDILLDSPHDKKLPDTVDQAASKSQLPPYDTQQLKSNAIAQLKADDKTIVQRDTFLIQQPINNNIEAKKFDDFKAATSFRMQFLLLGLILQRRKTLIRYFILFILSGFFMSMHWNYFFLYLEKIYRNKFELISALSMVGQSILGELPFFILSRKVIQLFGRSHTLSISVISIGIRFLLYGFMLPNVNMYCIVIADCFQGPNYGLFYVVMTEVGLEYSFCDDETIDKLAERGELDRNNKHQVESVRLSLRSTIQSVAFACYEGIGVGLGSLVGGWIVSTWGFRTLWLTAAIGSISVGLINLCFEFLCREFDPEPRETIADSDKLTERLEFMEARRQGTLKRVASPIELPLPVAGKKGAAGQVIVAKPQPILTPSIQMMMVRKSAGGRHVAPPVAAAAIK